MISLAGPPHCNDLLGEHFTRHYGFVIRGKGAARPAQNIPRGIECRGQRLGRFGVERCGSEKSQYRHRRVRQCLRRVIDLPHNTARQRMLAMILYEPSREKNHYFLSLKLENLCLISRSTCVTWKFVWRINGPISMHHVRLESVDMFALANS